MTMTPNVSAPDPCHPRPSVSVCFAAYNEESSLRAVLQDAYDLLSPSGLIYEILVCDDGSTDGTAAILADLASWMPGLRCLSHRRNLGIRETFEHLYAEARHELVFLNATDGQWPTAILFALLPLTSEWDIIVASRIDKHYGLMRQVVSWGYNMIPPLLFGVRTIDAGAVKLARREALQVVTPLSTSPFAEAERLIRAARAGYRITAYPVETHVRHAGRARGVSLRLVGEALRDVARVWWALRRERPRVARATRPAARGRSQPPANA